MIQTRSINIERSKNWGTEIPPENPRFVRAEMIKGFMYMEEIDQNSCWFHGFMNMNPKLALMPDWFFNFIIKRVVNVLIKKLQSKDFFDLEILKQRMEENPQKFESIK